MITPRCITSNTELKPEVTDRRTRLHLGAAPMVKKPNIYVKMSLYCNCFLTHVTHMHNVRNECYSYDFGRSTSPESVSIPQKIKAQQKATATLLHVA